MVPQPPRSPIFDQPKHPSVLLITAPYRLTASLPHSSSRQLAYPTPMHPDDQSFPLMKLTSSHICSTFSLGSPEQLVTYTMTNRIVDPLNLTTCALQSIRERPL